MLTNEERLIECFTCALLEECMLHGDGDKYEDENRHCVKWQKEEDILGKENINEPRT